MASVGAWANMRHYGPPQQTQNICITFVQRLPNVGPTLYKCYTNVLCLLGRLAQ